MESKLLYFLCLILKLGEARTSLDLFIDLVGLSLGPQGLWGLQQTVVRIKSIVGARSLC